MSTHTKVHERVKGNTKVEPPIHLYSQTLSRGMNLHNVTLEWSRWSGLTEAGYNSGMEC